MRTVAVGLAYAALVTEVVWLLLFDGALGWITATAVVIVAVHAITFARFHFMHVGVRVTLGLLLLGSVADRFGLFGAPGGAGVSWGSFEAFVDYTRTLLPGFASGLAGAAAVAATVLEVVLGAALVLGVLPRITAACTAGLLSLFMVAMWTALGFAAMSAYAVPVLVAGAAMIATAEKRSVERRSVADHRVVPEPA
ncbi:hypothetical protein [Nocardia suismassiliense]|uniref:hypothetical protein n=1 Tax=Nocardia suismassiliense TaxID=2077092 RepID=UPI00131EE8E3|nr:hypothetical protein [Nocardia suismassiliense]